VYLDKQRVGFGGWPLFAVQTAVTLTIAIASYRFIEQPIRRGAGSNIEWRKLTPAIAIGLVAAILLGTLGAHSIPETHIDAAALATPVFSAAIAFNSAAPGTRRVMIVGNSVAYSLGPGFRHVHADPPIASFDGGVPACVFPPEVTAPPVFAAGKTVQRAPCHARWEATVVNRFHPDVVFWIVSDGADGGVRYKGHTLKSCEEPYESIYRDSLRREITRLGARGAKVVITTEAYARYIGTRNVDRDTDCNNRIRREVARATGATLIDLFSFVCPKGQCRTTQDGVTLRIDGQHYIGPGGDIVAQWLMDQLDGRG
jgi:hypothetical protein